MNDNDNDNDTKLQAALDALHSADYAERNSAFKLLTELEDPRALPALMDLLRAPDWLVQMSSASTLGEIGDIQAVAPLIDALESEECLVIQEAALALGKIGDVRAIPALIDVLRSEELCSLYDREDGEAKTFYNVIALAQFEVEIRGVRTAAAGALGMIGDEEAIDGLVEALHDMHPTSVNDTAALALEQIGTPEALAAVAAWREVWGR